VKRYIQSSVTSLKLSPISIQQIEDGLLKIVEKHFYENAGSSIRYIKVSENEYDILRYTARPYSGYRDMSSELMMNEDKYALNEFKAEVRNYLKSFGVTRVRFDTVKRKLHYGYISGPDDNPVTQLVAIYFG